MGGPGLRKSMRVEVRDRSDRHHPPVETEDLGVRDLEIEEMGFDESDFAMNDEIGEGGPMFATIEVDEDDVREPRSGMRPRLLPPAGGGGGRGSFDEPRMREGNDRDRRFEGRDPMGPGGDFRRGPGFGPPPQGRGRGPAMGRPEMERGPGMERRNGPGRGPGRGPDLEGMARDAEFGRPELERMRDDMRRRADEIDRILRDVVPGQSNGAPGRRNERRPESRPANR